MSSASVFQLWLLACCRWFHLRSLNLSYVGRTAHNKTLPSNKNTSGRFRESNRRAVINHAEMMHCGLKNWKGKARLNIDIYYIPTVLAFTWADMKMYIQWKWEINPLVYILLDIQKWSKNQTTTNKQWKPSQQQQQNTTRICYLGMLQIQPSKSERLKGPQFWS